MLYHLLYPLNKLFSGFNVFKYITFRSAGAVLTALIVSFHFREARHRLAAEAQGRSACTR